MIKSWGCRHPAWSGAAYLFPAGALIARREADPSLALAALKPQDLYLALNARCSRKTTRLVRAVPSSSSHRSSCPSILFFAEIQ